MKIVLGLLLAFSVPAFSQSKKNTTPPAASTEDTVQEKPAPRTPPPAKDRFMAVYGSPLYLLLGALRAGADFGLGEKFTLGPTMMYAGDSFFRSSVTGYTASFFSIGGRGVYKLTKKVFQHGVYISPFVEYFQLRVENENDPSINATGTGIYYGALAGWMWFWRFGMSLELGIGYQALSMGDIVVNVGGTRTTVANSSNYSGLALATNLGWAF